MSSKLRNIRLWICLQKFSRKYELLEDNTEENTMANCRNFEGNRGKWELWVEKNLGWVWENLKKRVVNWRKYGKIFRNFLRNFKENVKEIWNIWGEIKKKKIQAFWRKYTGNVQKVLEKCLKYEKYLKKVRRKSSKLRNIRLLQKFTRKHELLEDNIEENAMANCRNFEGNRGKWELWVEKNLGWVWENLKKRVVNWRKYEKIFRNFLRNFQENLKEIWNIWEEIKKKNSSILKKIYGKCAESFRKMFRIWEIFEESEKKILKTQKH